MKLLAQGTVFQGEGSDCSALYPGVCVLPSGRWLVTFRAAPAREASRDTRAVFCMSDDQGATWSAPRAPQGDAPALDGAPGEYLLMYLTALPGEELLSAVMWIDKIRPDRPYHNPKTQGIVEHRIFFMRSWDRGETWSPLWELEGIPHTRPTALTGPVLHLPDGRLCCQFEVHKRYDEEGPVFFQGSAVFSRDGGRTWGEPAAVSYDPEMKMFYWDERLNWVNGKLMGLFWTYDGPAACYRNIHAASSPDGGHTWEQPCDTGVPGQPSQPVQLTDGSLAMAYVDRTGAPVIKARRSLDGGRTWPAETELTIYDSKLDRQSNEKSGLNDMWTEIYQFSVGFPCAAALPDGQFLVCFYAGPDTDHTAIRWARVGL